MTDDTLPPYFPATVPAALEDPRRTADLLEPVLADLADVVRRTRPDDLRRPTPCIRLDVEALRNHIVGWVPFFAAALADFQAVAELGWIAGSGVLLCALACFTVLPAALTLFDRRQCTAPADGPVRRPIGRRVQAARS